MQKSDLALILSKTIVRGPWATDALKTRLANKLPRGFSSRASTIAANLLRDFPQSVAPPAKAVAQTLVATKQFEAIMQYCQRHGTWPQHEHQPPVMLPIPAFASLDVPQLPTLQALADWLLLEPAQLDRFADISGRQEKSDIAAINHYHYAVIAKRSRGVRLVEAPKTAIKALQRQILRGILDHVPASRHAFGFVRGRNCIGSAGRHAGEQMVIRFDLKDFFPSVGFGRIFGLFRCLGYPEEVSRHLASLCTTRTPPGVLQRLPAADRQVYQQAHLPQGAPSSPSLANHVAFALDRRLSRLAASVDANYSRYADDLCFSGDRAIAATILGTVPEIVRAEGFINNASKTHIMSSGSRQLVTGLVVNRHVNIARDRYDTVKAIVHACGKADDLRLRDPLFRAGLLGQIGWIEACNPKKGLKLRQKLEQSRTAQTSGSFAL
jgi:RNA-directed DNA polymerase